MTSASRMFKRIFIAGTVMFFMALFGASWYFLSAPATTCFDGERNQGEQGTDCGGPCSEACPEVYDPAELIVREAAFVPGGEEGVYDVLGTVYNPNDELGASDITYVFRLKGASGETLVEMSGRSFILPQETKTILAVGLRAPSRPQEVEIVFPDAEWEKFSGYRERPALSILYKRYEKIADGPFFGEATGTLSNDSLFDFGSIVVKVILRDADGKPIAFNQTEMNTVLSKENRDFRLRWPKAFPGEVASIDVEPEADIYHSENFIRRYIETGKFQDLQGK